MDLEALLLGIEPMTALAVGIGAVVLGPVVKAANSALKDTQLGESLPETARELTKSALVWGFEALENAKTTYAQAEESFRDLVADAKLEHMAKKSEAETPQQREIEIVSR